MRSIAANALTLFIVLGLAIAGAIAYGVRAVDAPGPTTTATTFLVPRGAGLERVSNELERQGVIASASLFRMAARYEGFDGALRYGEYEAPAGASTREVLALVASGRTVQHFLTVAEGLTSREVVRLVEASELLSGEIDATPPEGSLAPDTYAVQRGDTRAEVIARMRALQERRVAQAWEERQPGLALRNPEDLVKLASVIEKETGVAAERERVAAVFHNRLQRGMRLQSDPTIIYGITQGEGPLDRPLTRADIQRQTPWNTYTIDGLPQTPIANPGLAALMAAAKPIETDELFFVADGTGGHAFARTLQEHNRNVAAWRAIERQRAQQ